MAVTLNRMMGTLYFHIIPCLGTIASQAERYYPRLVTSSPLKHWVFAEFKSVRRLLCKVYMVTPNHAELAYSIMFYQST